MKFRITLCMLFVTASAYAEDPTVPHMVSATARAEWGSPPSPTDAPVSWLGIDLSKPDHSLISHLPSLPPGVGFLVKTVHPDGPAAAAGLKPSDLVWRLNDQLLVNEAQLSALLRLHSPGEMITLSTFRGGSQFEIEVTLGHSPLPARKSASRAAEEAIFLSEQSPMRVINLNDREAYIANSDGRASVRKVGETYWLSIQNAEGEVIFDDRFDRGSGQCERMENLPREWKRRAYALRRGLDHALEGRITAPRQPRPRVVPPPPSQ